jgi:hypothetical protein
MCRSVTIANRRASVFAVLVPVLCIELMSGYFVSLRDRGINLTCYAARRLMAASAQNLRNRWTQLTHCAVIAETLPDSWHGSN